MKKIFLLILVVGMIFTVAACGGVNHDENNAVMQLKVDEFITIGQDVIDWIEENGYTEGEAAEKVQPVVDQIVASMEQIKTLHQEQLDNGGYTDEDVVRISTPIDKAIAGYKTTKEKLEASAVLPEVSPKIEAIAEKLNTLTAIVNETSEKAKENGWEKDEDYTAELNAALQILEIVKGDLEVPDSMDEEYMDKILTTLDEMIPGWQDYLTQVSKPYAANTFIMK